ncbi:MAG: SDR family NAD(P)-dependent oxidoreductase [Candidatus Nanoarchaeia archaeon]
MEQGNILNKEFAVITGSASGIGEAYARKLASLGHNLLLIDKNKEDLKKIAEDIKKKSKVEIGLIVADLSNEKDIKNISEKLSMTNVKILVNNAGFGISKIFAETEPELISAMIKVHVEATARFSRAVLPKMLEQNEGVIINISSIAVFFKNRKNNTMYESTKNFILNFSKALAREVEDTKVKVQVVCPGYTRTNFMTSETAKGRDFSMIPDWMWMTSEEVARESINALSKKKIVFIPGLINRIVVILLKSKVFSWLPSIWVRAKKKRKI